MAAFPGQGIRRQLGAVKFISDVNPPGQVGAFKRSLIIKVAFWCAESNLIIYQRDRPCIREVFDRRVIAVAGNCSSLGAAQG